MNISLSAEALTVLTGFLITLVTLGIRQLSRQKRLEGEQQQAAQWQAKIGRGVGDIAQVCSHVVIRLQAISENQQTQMTEGLSDREKEMACAKRDREALEQIADLERRRRSDDRNGNGS